MSADVLLVRLEGVKRVGEGRWLAKCPSHEDKRASLSIRELPDQRVLIHCFASCPVTDVLDAMQIDFTDLYPRRLSERNHREPRPFDPMTVLKCIETEVTLVLIYVRDMSKGIALSPTDHARLILATTRIHDALEVAHGH